MVSIDNFLERADLGLAIIQTPDIPEWTEADEKNMADMEDHFQAWHEQQQKDGLM